VGFVGWLWTVAAVAAMLVSFSLALWKYERLRSWSRTDAQIMSSEIYSKRSWVRGRRSFIGYWHTTYGFHCMVAYSANGERYESPTDLGTMTDSPSFVLPWPERLPPGTKVVVAYDPMDPTRVALTGDYRMTYATALVGARLEPWFLLAGLSLLAVSRKLRGSSEIDTTLHD
jgi:hypothetical protein